MIETQVIDHEDQTIGASSANTTPTERQAYKEVQSFLKTLLGRKKREDVDQPKLANQLKWYVLAHPRIIEALMEKEIYRMCYGIVVREVGALRSEAWASQVAAIDHAREQVAATLDDKELARRWLRNSLKIKRTEMDSIEAKADELGIDLHPVNPDAYAAAPLRYVEDEASAREGEEMARLEHYQMEVAYAAQAKEDRARRMARWQDSSSEWAKYRETISAHVSRSLPMMSGLDLDRAVEMREQRIDTERKTVALLTALRVNMADDELVGEHYEVEEVELMASGIG